MCVCDVQGYVLQPDDHAFVVAHLQGTAWPPDTLGFSNLDPPLPPEQTDLLVPHHQHPGTASAHDGGCGDAVSPDKQAGSAD